MKKLVTFVGLTLAAGACAYAAAVPAIYTPQQAADGQAVFGQNCASCHGNDLQGGVGPTLAGQDFASASGNITIGRIFGFLSTQMPDGNGGSLTHTQYEDIMAYILKKNGYPAGKTKLDYTAATHSAEPIISNTK